VPNGAPLTLRAASRITPGLDGLPGSIHTRAPSGRVRLSPASPKFPRPFRVNKLGRRLLARRLDCLLQKAASYPSIGERRPRGTSSQHWRTLVTDGGKPLGRADERAVIGSLWL
jgi:hypothetical protein